MGGAASFVLGLKENPASLRKENIQQSMQSIFNIRQMKIEYIEHCLLSIS
jgi:hypothetical protein